MTRATLGRILDDLGDHGWVVEYDRQYETTQLGGYVSREVTAALEQFEPVPALNGVAQWFPDGGFEFDRPSTAWVTLSPAVLGHIHRRIGYRDAEPDPARIPRFSYVLIRFMELYLSKKHTRPGGYTIRS